MLNSSTHAELLREMVRTLIRKLGILERSEASCCDMTLSQCHAVVEIGRAGSLSVTQLAERLCLDKSTVSRSIDKLVLDGLLFRSEDPLDRRYNVIRLSGAGEKSFADLENWMNSYFEELVQNIPVDKREQTIEGLRTLIGALHKSNCCQEGIFMEMEKQQLRDLVRQKYACIITDKQGCECGSNAGCGGNFQSTATKAVTGNLYSAEEIANLPEDLIAASLGCGNPTALTPLHAGETVLDLGSGAGLDVLLSARRVGSSGKVYGLDMTDEMLQAANTNKERVGITNAEFLKGHIEAIPLPDNAVDVVISNCVINLSTDKDAVFREVFRVLKPGGRMAVSDIVLRKQLPKKIAKNITAWAGCMAGALHEDDYRGKLAAAGFTDVNIEITRFYDPKDLGLDPMDIEGAPASAFIRAKKPAQLLSPVSDFTIRIADACDFPVIRELLSASALPGEGVDPSKGTFFVAEDPTGILGVTGFELYNNSALLRSLAVRSNLRKRGLAKALVEGTINELEARGITNLYLLTTTAETYAHKFGFVTIPRSQMPAVILKRSLLGCACPSTSVCMHLG